MVHLDAMPPCVRGAADIDEAALSFIAQAVSGPIMAQLRRNVPFSSVVAIMGLAQYINDMYREIVTGTADVPTQSWFRVRMAGHSPVCVLNIAWMIGRAFLGQPGLQPVALRDDPTLTEIMRYVIQYAVRHAVVDKLGRSPMAHPCTGLQWDAMATLRETRADGSIAGPALIMTRDPETGQQVAAGLDLLARLARAEVERQKVQGRAHDACVDM